MADPTRVQYAELGARILTALPVNPDEGTVIVEYQADGIPLWGNPQRIEGVFFQMDLAVVPGAELDALRHAVERVRELCEEAKREGDAWVDVGQTDCPDNRVDADAILELLPGDALKETLRHQEP